MTRRMALVAVVAFATAAAPAAAELPHVPKHAKKMTQTLAYNASWNKLWVDLHDTVTWPRGFATIIDTPCHIAGRRRGVCHYKIFGSVIDSRGGDTSVRTCTGKVIVTISKSTHRVSSRKVEAGCDTKGPFLIPSD